MTLRDCLRQTLDLSADLATERERNRELDEALRQIVKHDEMAIMFGDDSCALCISHREQAKAALAKNGGKP